MSQVIEPVPVVERYLGEVTARLPGPAKAHHGILAELRTGLLDAADSYRSAGLTADQAAKEAVREFGDPGEVADGFRVEIAADQARHVVIVLLATGPLVGLLWIVTALAGHLPIEVRSSQGPGMGLPLVAVAVVVTAWAALLGIATTGRLTRWLPAQPRQAPTAAAVAGFGAMGADALGLALLAVELATTPGRLSPHLAMLLATTAAVASVARLLFAVHAVRRCLALRASLG